MTIELATKKFREFHLKEPSRVVSLTTKIPRYVVPVGYSVQISYHSNKWNKDDRFVSYIHFWENPTFVCCAPDLAQDVIKDFKHGHEFYSKEQFDLGANRQEVTFLGYAIDFNVSEDDRSKIFVPPFNMMSEENMDEITDSEKLTGSYAIQFSPNPKKSKDYVCCSPNGRIVYVICEGNGDVYAFINNKCKVTSHGIEG